MEKIKLLEELVNRGNELEASKMTTFYRGGTYFVIDQNDYNRWRSDSCYYLDFHFGKEKSQSFMDTTASFVYPEMEGQDVSELQNGLNMLTSILNYGFSSTTKNLPNLNISKIFISHASKDAEYVKAFVDLLTDIGLPKTSDKIFCSSIEEYGIPNGENIYEYIKRQYDQGIWVIFILSENYYKSVACLNEMGATWATSTESTSILLPEFEFSKIDGAIDPREISFKMSDPYRLNEFKTKVQETFGLEDPNGNNWDRSKEKFLGKVNELIERNASHNEDIKGVIEKIKKSRNSIEVTLRLINDSSTQKHIINELEFILTDSANNTVTEVIEIDEHFRSELWPNENRIEKIIFQNTNDKFNANRCKESLIKVFC